MCGAELPPPFWAFAWPGGQALARYVLDHPDLVRDRHVFDLASGSGLVAIAAARAGAASVVAVDIDPLAGAAIGLNAEVNDAEVSALLQDALDGNGEGADVILGGDVFYERAMAGRVLPFLLRGRARGASVLVGDPGRAYLPRDHFRPLATYDVPASRAVEDAEIKRTAVWMLAPEEEAQ